MGLGDLPGLVRTVDRRLLLEGKHGKAIEELGTEIDALKQRVTRLESREDLVVAEARAAAGAAATHVSVASLADLARRIGRLEERTDHPRLSPPDLA